MTVADFSSVSCHLWCASCKLLAWSLTLPLLSEAVKALALISQNDPQFLLELIQCTGIACFQWKCPQPTGLLDRPDPGYPLLSRHCVYETACGQGKDGSEAGDQSIGDRSVHMHVRGRSRGYIIELAWKGGGARNEAGTSSFQHVLFTPAFHCSSMLRPLWHVGPHGLQNRLMRRYFTNMNVWELQGWGRRMGAVAQDGEDGGFGLAETKHRGMPWAG